MENTSLPTFGQHQDGQPSESSSKAKSATRAVKDRTLKRPPVRKRGASQLLSSKPYLLLHRIAEVRLQQGISLRAVSRRTGIPVRELRDQEQPQSNITLRDLHIWKDALEVPLEHLLLDRDMSVSESIQSRALLIRIMKTVISLKEIVVSQRPSILLDLLRQQLVELMPELRKIQGWPSSGSRIGDEEAERTLNEPIVISQLSFQGD